MSQRRARANERITPRALFIGLAGTVLLAVATPVSDFLINGTWLAACHLPIGVVCVFVALRFVVDRLLARANRRLSRGEWVTLYSMMLASAGLTSLGFSAYVVPTLAAIPYFATPENDWLALLSQHLPTWIAPFDERASRLFFDGGDAPVPWRSWFRPLCLWGLYGSVLLWTMVCVCALLRRQWIERERLAFPLVQLPLELLEPASARAAKWPLVVGAAIPFVVHAVNGLRGYVPSLPAIPLFFDLGRYFTAKPWNVVQPFWIILHFSAVGFVYLLPVDLSFSLWAFYFLFHAQAVAMTTAGIPLGQSTGYATRGFAAYQMAGAILALGVVALWRARHWFGELANAARRGNRVDGEVLSPRAAFGGLVAGVAALVAAEVAAGIPAWLAFATNALFLLTMVSMTRMVSEGGLLFIQTPFRPTDLLTPFIGSAPLTRRGLAVLNMQEMVFAFDVRSSPMPSVMDAFRFLESSRLNRRAFLPPVAVACAVAMVVACATTLLIGKANGAATVSGWFGVGAPQLPFNRMAAQIVNGAPPDGYSVLWMGVGTVCASLFTALRARFLGFAVHPIGYAMGPSWPMIQLWFSTFLGWAMKFGSLRFGGIRLYRRWRPIFLGMVLGEFVAGGFWVVVDFIFGKQGHRIFLF